MYISAKKRGREWEKMEDGQWVVQQSGPAIANDYGSADLDQKLLEGEVIQAGGSDWRFSPEKHASL